MKSVFIWENVELNIQLHCHGNFKVPPLPKINSIFDQLFTIYRGASFDSIRTLVRPYIEASIWSEKFLEKYIENSVHWHMIIKF